MRSTTSLVVICGGILLSHHVQADEPIHFNRDIRPILSDKCFACHGLDRNARKADLRLDDRAVAVETKAIVPGKPGESHLIERILSSDPDVVMPPPKFNKSLTEAEKSLLRRWIAEGAEYHPHWAFIPVPKEVPVPQPTDTDGWIRTPIDAFVLQRLQRVQVPHAADATREKWLRRVCFDLTGLPPTTAQLDQFLSDNTEQAFEAAVDRLLESPAYGERMASDWLDVARYADTFGYQSDRDTHVWPWRDWVIRAFNENLPYDQFILWQTAGDLLPNATRDQQLATTFNRLHRQTNEGGSIEEEFRQTYIADRVVTNGTAFLGMTLECCRCHNHKYDPIEQAEFYKLAAFFANIDEHGLYSHFTETAPTPALLLFEGEQQSKHDELLQAISQKQHALERIREEAKQRFAQHPLSRGDVALDALRPAGAKYQNHFEDAKPNGENRLVPGVMGQAIEFDGDDAFPCSGAGQYGRTNPFSISLWLKSAEHKPRVVVLHQCVAAEDAAYRGYSLVLDSGKLQLSLIHFWPGNAIQIQSEQAIPERDWAHVGIVYDGSSEAAGCRLFINGQLAKTDVIRDKLTRDIRYRSEWGDSNSGGVELSLGARFRDVGFRGGAIDELQVFDRALSALEVAALFRQVPTSGTETATPLNPDVAARFEHYLLNHDAAYRTALQEALAARSAENEFVTGVRQIMTMRELPSPRPTHILKRGAYDAPGDLVTADTPRHIFPFPDGLPRNRLGLAQWMIDERNPLPSRVAANRYWSLFFGRGIVASVEDFGGQGQVPSHPELLDWLARDLMDHGWDLKRFCKQIVLSSVYRQSSVPADRRLPAEDPENQLLAHAPRYRLPAEQIRDNALAMSGLLVNRQGGPSVMPYQPAGLWEESGTGKSYHQSKGEGLYRRSLYTFWRRTSPPPNMLTFDATSHEVCTARRERTSTPLQALVLLNDPQYVEACRVLAEKCLKANGETPLSRIQELFRICTSRLPTEQEAEILVRLYNDQRSHFDANLEAANEFLGVGETKPDDQLNPADLAALTVVAESLLNFEECVTKR